MKKLLYILICCFMCACSFNRESSKDADTDLVVDTLGTTDFSDIALTYINSGKPDSALIYIDSILLYNPARLDLYEPRAIAHILVGDIPASIKDFDNLIRIEKAPQAYIEHIACIYEDLGEHESAIHFLELALMKVYESNVDIIAKLEYARMLDSIDPGNKVAYYVHEQILPSGSDTYLPGFDDDIDDVHDMELYFSDPYF